MQKFKSWINENMSVGSSSIRGMGYVSGSADGDSPSYVDNNIDDAESIDKEHRKMTTMHVMMHKSIKSASKATK